MLLYAQFLIIPDSTASVT